MKTQTTKAPKKSSLKVVVNETAEMPELNIKAVALSDIGIRKNYRKYFNEESIQDLAENLKVVGVLQAIVIRPVENGVTPYELVAGERRYRACLVAGFTHIPASIKVLTEDQAIEIQLMENIQREGVHAMDEAWAFIEMRERGQTEEDIALKIGKSKVFVAQRLKLNDLIEELQILFREDGISIAGATLLARITVKHQQIWLEGEANGYGDTKTVKAIQGWINRKANSNLASAIFDLNDETLIAGVPSCSNCPHNSSCNISLFADIEKPTCFDSICFSEKNRVAKQRKVEQAIAEHPGIVLLNNTHSDYGVEVLIEKLKEGGHIVIKDNYSFNELVAQDLTAPVEPKAEDFEEEDDFKEAVEQYNDDLEAFNSEDRVEEIKEYEAKKATAVKAFVFNGKKEGEIVLGFLTEKMSTADHIQASPESGLKAQLQVQITKRERGLELDREKVYEKLRPAFWSLPHLVDPKPIAELNQNEQNALLLMALSKVGDRIDRILQNEYQISRWPGKGDFKANLDRLIALSPEVKNMIFRGAAASVVSDNSHHSMNSELLFRLGYDYPESGIEAMAQEQNTRKEKRESRMDERIAEIQKQILELQAEKDKLENEGVTEEEITEELQRDLQKVA